MSSIEYDEIIKKINDFSKKLYHENGDKYIEDCLEILRLVSDLKDSQEKF